MDTHLHTVDVVCACVSTDSSPDILHASAPQGVMQSTSVEMELAAAWRGVATLKLAW